MYFSKLFTKFWVSYFKHLLLLSVAFPLCFTPLSNGVEFEVSGNASLEQRYFFEKPANSVQLHHGQASLALESEFYWQWNNGGDSVIFTPFYRFDSQDAQRTHGDVRELAYVHVGDDWELRLGIRKEFWGVTEFQHLVDVINQTDGVEDFDGEDKLGQQMINLSLVRDWGTFDAFLLPGFRERTFVGDEGRLRGLEVVDDNINYESSAGQQHLDFALRWTLSIAAFDIGTSWFHGTNREPILYADSALTNLLFHETNHNIGSLKENNKIALQQYYMQMDQLGLDIQATLGDWLWKFEGLYRDTNNESFWATQAGFEYSFIGVFNSNVDLGVLMEHGWDSRGEVALGTSGSLLQNDLFLGARIAFNDMQSTAILMGMSSDLDHHGFSFIIEASRRLGDNFKATLDVRFLQSNDINDLLYTLNQDDHAQFSLAWYF